MRAALVASLFAVVVCAGCPQGLLPCRAAGDCTAPQICVAGSCVESCNSNADCSSGQSCVDGACVAGSGEGEGPPGEGEGSPGEGEGAPAEGEGEGALGEGEGEGEGSVGEGEGEGEGADPLCGNGALDGAEQCDDGNTTSGDGCSATCTKEAGFACTSDAPTICEQLPAADKCLANQDPFHVDINGDCIPDLVVGAPGQAAAFLLEGLADGQFDLINSQNSPALGDPQDVASGFGSTIAIEPDVGHDGNRGIYLSRPNAATPEIWYVTISTAFLTEAFGAVSKQGAANLGASLVVLRSGPNAEGRLLFTDGPSLFLGNNAPPSTGPTEPPTAVALDATLIVDGTQNAVRAVALGPDEDGDGLADVAVATSAAVTFVSALTLAPVGRTINAPSGVPGFGETLVNLGDIDGDAKDDLAIGAPTDGKGRLFVNLTSAGSSLVEVVAPAAFNDRARFGIAAASFGDVDGDGVTDVAIGAPFRDQGGSACSATVACPTGFTCTNSVCIDATNDPHCKALLGDNAYAGDCGGAVTLVRGADLKSAAASAAATAQATDCIDTTPESDVARFGSALAPLGAAPNTTSPRLAVGAPADPLRATPQNGAVFIVVFTADATTCTLDGNQTIQVGGPFTGGEFGAAFGR